jgi:competence protein ComEC
LKLDKLYLYGSLFLASVFVWQIFLPLPTAPFSIPADTELFFTAYVASEPVRKETYVRYEIVLPKLQRARFLVYDDLTSTAEFGKTFIFSGKITKPTNFSEFDWVAYLARRNIFYEVRFPKVEENNISTAPQWVRIQQKLFSFRNAFSNNINKVVPEPAASLANGELLGEKQTLAKELDDALKIAGVTHVVVLSGHNISIVAGSIMRVFSFLPRAPQMLLALLGIFSFVAATGFSASVVRAACMASILLFAQKSGALYSARRALFIVALGMVFIKPSLLVYDVSFQLSFLATAGILYGQKYFEKKLTRIPARFGFREMVATTCAAQVAVLPLLIHLSGGVQIFSLLANVLILPTVPVAMLLSFVAGTLGFISYTLSYMVGVLATIVLSYQVMVVMNVGNILWAHVPLPTLFSYLAGILYILFVIRTVWKEEKN